MRLKDKVILVTGSTTGIGEACARAFAAAGAAVLVSGRNADRDLAVFDLTRKRVSRLMSRRGPGVPSGDVFELRPLL